MCQKGFTTFMSTERGFTLIELLVVITIIAVLAGVGLVSYQEVQGKARDSIRKQDLRSLATALEIFNQRNGSYIVTAISWCSLTNNETFYTGITPFMANQKVPVDPLTGDQYCYYSTNDGGSFRLFAVLENCSDPEIIGTCLPNSYNFSVTSPDLTIEPHL